MSSIIWSPEEYDKMREYFKIPKSKNISRKRIPPTKRINFKKLDERIPIRYINEKKRKRDNERREDMRKIKQFMKTGFERSFEIITDKIQATQEMTSITITSKFTALQNEMKQLNQQMVAVDKKQYQRAKVLQYRILFVQKQIDNLRKQTMLWIQQLNTANQKRQEQILKYIEQLSQQAVKLAEQLSKQLGDTEKHLSDGIVAVSKQVVELQRMINERFGSLENFIRSQGLELRSDFSAGQRSIENRIQQLIASIDAMRAQANPPASHANEAGSLWYNPSYY